MDNTEKTTTVTADIDYIVGNPKGGYLEAQFTDEELKKFKSLDEREQARMLSNHGELKWGYLDIEDWGGIENIEIHE